MLAAKVWHAFTYRQQTEQMSLWLAARTALPWLAAAHRCMVDVSAIKLLWSASPTLSIWGISQAAKMSFATKPAAAAVDMTPSNRRFLVMALLFVTVVINYLDRSNLSIAAPSITSEFGLNPVQLGVVFSAFGWTYTPLQIPGGWLVDRVHPRVLYPLTIFFWSIATLCLGLSTGLVMLIILRMTVGLFEVPSFLINNRIATTWFGERERATCIAVYTSAEFAAGVAEGNIWLAGNLLLYWRARVGVVVRVPACLPRSGGVSRRQSGRGRVDPLCIALLGACSYIFAVGKLERVRGWGSRRVSPTWWPAIASSLSPTNAARTSPSGWRAAIAELFG
jgi:MFS family permease